MAAGEWDVETKLTPLTDEQHRELRHADFVVAKLQELAQQIVDATGNPDDFEVLVQNESEYQRARAFAKPKTGRGIRLELRDSLLLKSIAGMSGQ